MSKQPLNRLGLLFLKKQYLIVWFILVSMVVLACFCLAYVNFSKLDQLQNRLSMLQSRANLTLAKRKNKDHFLNRHILADPYYLDNTIESLQFIQPELSYLKTFSSHPAYKNTEKAQKKLQILSGQNFLRFSEDTIRPSAKIQETEEIQINPIFMNHSDLENLLCLIEEAPIGELISSDKQPQLVIRQFHLRKTPLFDQNEVFSVKMKLLKREFLKQKSES